MSATAIEFQHAWSIHSYPAIALYQGRGHPQQKYVDAFYEAGYTHAQSLDVVACIAAKVMTNYTNALGGTELDEPLKPLAVGLDFDAR